MLPRTSSIWRRDSHPTASGKPGACVDAPGLQGDSRTFWRLGAYIARVSGLFAWLIVCHWPVCSSKNEVHIGSKSYDARAPGLVSTS
jgi:hypothetical protein